MSDTLVPRDIRVLAFHADPHADELLAVFLGVILGAFRMNWSTVSIRFSVSDLTNKEAQRLYEEEGWLFVGMTPNADNVPADKMWHSPVDEHGVDLAGSAAELVFRMVGGEERVPALLQALLRQFELPSTWEDAREATKRLTHLVRYVTIKDNSTTAMFMGLSWLLKQFSRMHSCFVAREGGKRVLRYAAADEVFVRDLLRVSVDVLTTIVFCPQGERLKSKEIKRISREMARWYTEVSTEDANSAWKPKAGRKLTVEQLHTWMQAKVCEREQLHAKKGWEFRPPSALLSKVEGLGDLLQQENNISWYSLEAWLLKEWGVQWNREARAGICIGQNSTFQSVVADLRSEAHKAREQASNLPKAKKRRKKEQRAAREAELKQRASRLEGWARSLEDKEMYLPSEQAARNAMDGDPRMDERYVGSPYGLLAVCAGLHQRSKRTDGLALPKERVWTYLHMALQVYWRQEDLKAHADRTIGKEGKVQPSRVTWAARSMRALSTLMVDGANPMLAARIRSQRGWGRDRQGRPVPRYPVFLITNNTQRKGSVYVSANSRWLGHAWINLFLRELVLWYRICEYRYAGIALPDNLEELSAGEKCKDGVWYPHVVDHDGSEDVVQLLVRSHTHPNDPGTRLDAERILWPALNLLFDLFQVLGSRVRYGTQEFDGTYANIKPALKDIRQALATATNPGNKLVELGASLPGLFTVIDAPLLPLT